MATDCPPYCNSDVTAMKRLFLVMFLMLFCSCFARFSRKLDLSAVLLQP